MDTDKIDGPTGRLAEQQQTVRDQRDPQTYSVIGAAFEVHRQLGPGFLESVYHAALSVELLERAVPFARECDIAVVYKGRPLECAYRADFICYGEVIVEIKAMDGLTGREYGQLLNYLKATGLKRGLLLNFGAARLEYKRLVC